MKKISPEKIERVHFFGGLIVCLVFLGLEFLSDCFPEGLSFFRNNLDSWTVLASVAFGIFNFRCWRAALSLLVGAGHKTEANSTPIRARWTAAAIIFLKMGFVLMVVLYLAQAPARTLISFLLGFTAFLFVGMFLTLIFGRFKAVEGAGSSG